MEELKLVNQAFQAKQVIWLRGPEGSRSPQIIQEMLFQMGAIQESIGWVTAYQFIDMMDCGTIYSFANRYSALVIYDFESHGATFNQKFLEQLLVYSSFKNLLSFRVVLTSGVHFADAESFESLLNPLVVMIPGIGEDPSDLNERIHSLLADAARIAQKRVTGITAGLAEWLESEIWDENDDELLILFISALLQMESGTILGLKHIQAVAAKNDQIPAENRLLESV